jgi:hypothetical protein
VRETAGKRYRTAIVRPTGSNCRVPCIAIRLLCGVALAWPVIAAAGLYKCARDDGTVMYQEDPCPAGKELRDFERDPATVSVVPFRVVPGPDSRSPEARSAEPSLPHASKAERKARKTSEREGNAAERKFLVPGIGEGEVVARVGRPDMSSGAGRKTVRWTYMPAPEDPGTITTLTFELGRLVQVERKVIRSP